MKLKILITIIISVFISLIHGLPHILIPCYLNGKYYSPLVLNSQTPFYTVDETYVYAGRTQASLRDGFFLKDPQIEEYKDKPSLYISESIPARFMALLSIRSVPSGFILSDFILPVVNFIMLMFFLYLMTNRFYLSTVGSYSVLFGSYLLKNIQFPFSFLLRLQSDINNGTLLHFTRSFHPQVSFIFLMLALISLYLLISKKSNKLIIPLGLLSGFLFYTYIYYLPFFWAGFIIISIIFAFKKEMFLLKKLLAAALISFIIAIPFITSYIRFFTDSSLYNNFQLNFTTPADDNFWLNIKVIFTILAVWLVLRKKQAVFYFIEAFLIGGLLLCNMQYLLNKNINFSGHLEVRALYPWIIISLFTILANIYIRKNLLKFLLLFVFVFLSAYGFLTHLNYSRNYYNAYTLSIGKKEIVEWFKTNTKKNSIVLTNSFMDSQLIAALSHNKVFIPHSFLSFAPSEEILERVFIAYKLLELPDNSIREIFERKEEKVKNMERHRWDFDTCGAWIVFLTRYSRGNYYQCFVDNSLTEKLVNDYHNFFLDDDKLNKYKFDYVLAKKGLSNSLNERFKKVFENEDYLIFSN